MNIVIKYTSMSYVAMLDYKCTTNVFKLQTIIIRIKYGNKLYYNFNRFYLTIKLSFLLIRYVAKNVLVLDSKRSEILRL